MPDFARNLPFLLLSQPHFTSNRGKEELKESSKNSLPPTGLEPAIPGLGGRCLIHWATEAYIKRRLNIQVFCVSCYRYTVKGVFPLFFYPKSCTNWTVLHVTTRNRLLTLEAMRNSSKVPKFIWTSPAPCIHGLISNMHFSQYSNFILLTGM